MYTNEDLTRDCLDLFRQTEGNRIDIPGIGETVLFDEPIMGFASVEDDIFEVFRRKEVIGANYFGPGEWLPEAQSVISFFLPFSETVRASNRTDRTDPSREWLYARIEGQEFIGKYMDAVRHFLEEHPAFYESAYQVEQRAAKAESRFKSGSESRQLRRLRQLRREKQEEAFSSRLGHTLKGMQEDYRQRVTASV